MSVFISPLVLRWEKNAAAMNFGTLTEIEILYR